MTENTITISVEEYKDLLKKAERIAAIERMFKDEQYLCTKDILNVLNLRRDENACV